MIPIALAAALALADAPTFDVVAEYPATLVHALDAAAGVPHHGSGYREWLLGTSDADPDWMRAYRQRRPTWTSNVDDGDGPYEPYTRASYDAKTVDDLLERIGKILSGDDLAAARAAIVGADKLLAPRWSAEAAKLAAFGGELREALTNEKARALVARLRAACGLAADAPLRFRVVLVAQPKATRNSASTEGDHLVMEVPDGSRATREAPIAFHEMTHFAARRSPGRRALEDAFAPFGEAGVVAANYWDEAFATAFGNGIVASALDPQFAESAPLYAVPAIDAIGRGLWEKWKTSDVALGAPLAATLVEIVGRVWPRERWTLRDLWMRCEVMADDRAIVQAFFQRVLPSSLSAQTPVPASLVRPPRPPEKVPRIVFLAKDALASKPDLLKAMGLDASDAAAHADPASIHFGKDEDGVPLALVVARDADALVAAASALEGSGKIPPAGWSPLAP
jgi:hypothetical protein